MALDKTIQFRANSEEKEHLVKAASDAKMKLSAYLRATALHRTVIVVGEELGVVVIPATESTTAQDERIMAAVQATVEGLNDQGPTPAASDVISGAPPASAPASQAQRPAPSEPSQPMASVPAAAPGAVPATSPGEGEPLAGVTSSQEPPADAAPGMSGVAVVADSAAGAIPGPEETLKGDDALEPGGAGACSDCGGVDGRHQSFCEQVTGVPPVATEEEAVAPPQPEGAAIESHEQFIERRVAEGELPLVAEAEWRKLTTSGQAPEPQMAACPNCGTMKSTAMACPDCGAPPQ